MQYIIYILYKSLSSLNRPVMFLTRKDIFARLHLIYSLIILFHFILLFLFAKQILLKRPNFNCFIFLLIMSTFNIHRMQRDESCIFLNVGVCDRFCDPAKIRSLVRSC